MTDTPKNLDGMVVGAGELMAWLLKKDGDPKFCAGMVQAMVHRLARPEQASAKDDDRYETLTSNDTWTGPTTVAKHFPINGIPAYIDELVGPCTKCGGDVVILMNKSMNAPDFSPCRCPPARPTPPDAGPRP